MKTTLRHAGIGAAAAAAVLAMPATALAEEEKAVGADILLPKMSEFIPALVAFIIILVIMVKFVWPPVLKMMEDRENKIKGDLDSAADAKAQAEAQAKEYEAKILEARAEGEKIIAQAKKEAEEERSQVLARAQREAADIIAKAHGAVDSERHKAMIELSGSVVDLSVEIASKIIGNDLSADEQRKLAEKYLAEVGTPDGE